MSADLASRVHDLVRVSETRNRFRCQVESYIFDRREQPGIAHQADVDTTKRTRPVEMKLAVKHPRPMRLCDPTNPYHLPGEGEEPVELHDKYAVLAAVHDTYFVNDGPIMADANGLAWNLSASDADRTPWYVLLSDVKSPTPPFRERWEHWYMDVVADLSAKGTNRTRRRRVDRQPTALTAKQLEASQLYGELKGDLTAVGKRMGISRQAAVKHYKTAMRKLGKAAMPKAKTQSLPKDERGQETV